MRDEVQDRLPLACDAGEDCEQIAEGIEPFADRTESEIRKIVMLMDEALLLLLRNSPCKPFDSAG